MCVSSFDTETFTRLSLAAVAGGIVGIERLLKNKPVGIKTLTVVAVSSALLTVVSINSVEEYAMISDNINMDPMRLAAQIVSGVGFIGAGLIMKKSNNDVSGLTTAAILWGVSAIGISIGAGFIQEAFIAMVFFLIGVELVPNALDKYTQFGVNQKMITLSLEMPRHCDSKEILRDLKLQNVHVKSVHIRDGQEKKEITIRGYVGANAYVTDIYEILSQKDEIKKIDITE